LDGVVTVVNPHEGAKRLTIEFVESSDNLAAGETFTIQFEERSSENFILVPNSAVNRDGDGYFLNQVRRRQGMLGTEYYTEKLRVYIGDSDTENTAIIRGITFFEPIALASDKPFAERESIRLRNESDFFEE
jgi:multidrug efflux pump subunit AcrA (membrane-fusion protein)